MSSFGDFPLNRSRHVNISPPRLLISVKSTCLLCRSPRHCPCSLRLLVGTRTLNRPWVSSKRVTTLSLVYSLFFDLVEGYTLSQPRATPTNESLSNARDINGLRATYDCRLSRTSTSRYDCSPSSDHPVKMSVFSR